MAAPLVSYFGGKLSTKWCLTFTVKQVRRIGDCSRLRISSAVVNSHNATDSYNIDAHLAITRQTYLSSPHSDHTVMSNSILRKPLLAFAVKSFSRSYSAKSSAPPPTEIITQLTALEYEEISEETLQSLTEVWEELCESLDNDDIDISYASGVLTVKLGSTHGTYVINKQTPNKQIWFSSPVSGPKRYDYVEGKWKYKYDEMSLHERLSNEVSHMFQRKVDFTACSHAK